MYHIFNTIKKKSNHKNGIIKQITIFNPKDLLIVLKLLRNMILPKKIYRVNTKVRININ
jgi:hypothetical protein